VQAIIESKLRSHRQHLSYLQSRYQEEMLKGCRARDITYLNFLWQELSVYRFVVDELQNLLEQSGEVSK